MKNTKRGFTIVELVIVIAVIAILAAILIPVFADVTSSADATANTANIKSAYNAFVADQALDAEPYLAIEDYYYYDGEDAFAWDADDQSAEDVDYTPVADDKVGDFNGYSIYKKPAAANP